MNIPAFTSITASMIFFYCPAAFAGSPVIAPPLKEVVAHVRVENPGDRAQVDTVLHLAVDELDLERQEQVRDLVVYRGDRPLPTQPLDADGDGTFETVAALVDLEAGETLTLIVALDAPVSGAGPWAKRTQAELSRKMGGSWKDGVYVDGDFVNVASLTFDGQLPYPNDFMRYEGPGWESDKVGYRLYLDHRNGIDVFGKLIPAMVLQNVGTGELGSYHEPAFWGMDVLKVGSSLGMGGFGAWSEGKAYRVSETDRTRCTVLSNGPLLSQIMLEYEGWKAPDGEVNLKTIFSIGAGSYLTQTDLLLEGGQTPMVTGIPKHPEVQWVTGGAGAGSGEWRFLAGHGPQSLSGDNLGLVIFVHADSFDGFVEDEHNELIRLKTQGGKVSYHFGAVWESASGEAASMQSFRRWIESALQRLNNGPKVDIQPVVTP
jgi:hypothetical protein